MKKKSIIEVRAPAGHALTHTSPMAAIVQLQSEGLNVYSSQIYEGRMSLTVDEKTVDKVRNVLRTSGLDIIESI